MFPDLLIHTLSNGTKFAIIDDSKKRILSYTLGGIALLWFLMVFIYKSINKRAEPPLAPGPKPLPLLGNLLSLDPELHTYFADLAKTYGPILTIWLGRKPAFVLSSPALAKEVLKDQDVTFANRDVPIAGLEASYGGVDIVSTSYGPEWRMLRKVCVREMLCKATLDSMYGLRRRELRQTIQFLHSQSGKPVDIGVQMFLTVLNVITNMLWGGSVTGDEKASLASEFREVVHGITQCLGTPNVSDFYPSLARFDLQGLKKKTKILAGKFDQIFEGLIEQRMMNKKGEKQTDFLQFLLKLKEQGHAEPNTPPLTMTHVKALLSDMVVGGTETTSNSVEFALAQMMKKPEVMKKAQQELDTVVGRNRILEECDTQNLPYLYAVMKEVLRLHPALPLLVPHCPSETTVIGGYTVPRGARVFVNVWAVHRDPSIWENPFEFRPERFLEGEFDYSGNDLRYFPFGSGRRSCAGIAMGERMFMFSLATLIQSFDWKMGAGESLDVDEKFGIVLKKKKPLIAIPTPRLADSSLYLIS